MLVRIKFLKTGPLKFIGHLDIMRYFQKAFRRSGLDVEYSQGYSPHQIMSFAAPLGVGLTSEGEYLDVSFHSCDDTDTMIQRINESMNEHIQVTYFRILPEGSKNAMSIVAGADYKVSLKDGFEFLSQAEFQEKFCEFMNQEQIIVTKKSKKSDNEMDIKPLIYAYAFDKKSFTAKAHAVGQSLENEEIAQVYANGIQIYMKLAAGSVNNLKPDLVMEGFCHYVEYPIKDYAFQIHRIEIYALENQESKRLVPLLMA